MPRSADAVPALEVDGEVADSARRWAVVLAVALLAAAVARRAAARG